MKDFGEVNEVYGSYFLNETARQRDCSVNTSQICSGRNIYDSCQIMIYRTNLKAFDGIEPGHQLDA